MRGVRQKLSRPAVVLSGLALALSTLCAPAARAGLFDDEEARKAIIDLRTRFAAREVEAPLPDFRQAVEAVGLRLQEGKERPSEALPIRRQLLEAQLAALRRHHAHHTLAAELQSLLPEVKP